MKEVGGDCKFPIGACAYIKDNQFFIIGMVSNPQFKKLTITGDIENSENISKELAYRLLK
jgi:porphobilinogen deaminase